MEYIKIEPGESIRLFVKAILVLEKNTGSEKTVLPFFADGYPGLLFHTTENGLLVNPHNKVMPAMFLYGQTLTPIQLVMNGSYQLIVFQLYPFVLKSFFNVSPESLNNNCYNVEQPGNLIAKDTVVQLTTASSIEKKIEIITAFLLAIFSEKQEELDFVISNAIQKIIADKGQVVIRQLCTELHMNERTFERRFFSAVGVTAKQFSRIIQFQQSLEQLTENKFTRLTDIVYSNGFTDQSHFIKVFKAFTGKTPLAFGSQK